jgi:multidrug efflux system outer membrane protein
MMSRYLLSGMLVVLVTGCAVGPNYEKPAADIPDAWRVEYSDNAKVVNTLWWKQFNDPVLDELIQLALENNRDVRIAAARVEEFAARVDIARSGFYPRIGYRADGNRNKLSDDALSSLPPGTPSISNNFQATLNVGWELDVWGKIRRATESARASLLSAEEGRRTVILTLVTSVATSYVELRALDRRLEIARDALESRQKTLELFELQFSGGVVSQLEVAQVRSEYEQAAVSIPSLERQIALLENSLAVLLGQNPGPIPRGKTISELILPTIPEGIPSEVMEQRPDVRAAEQDLVAANAQIGAAKAQYFPSISLTGLLGFASNELSNLASSSASFWSAGGAIAGPVFTGGLVSGQVRVSEAVQKQALEGYLQTIQTAFREVDDALVSNQKSREELEAQARRVAALKEYAEFANIRYNEGQVSYIEVLDSERLLFEAELAYAQNQSAVYTALVNTYKAMGGGWVIEAEEVVKTAEQAQMQKTEETSSTN